MAAVANKRKRDTHDMPNPRAAPGIASGGDFDQSYLHTDDDTIDHSDANIDFAAALAQHNADLGDAGDASSHDQVQGNNRPNSTDHPGQSASDTAAAAMAQFHTMTVPQSTEQAFMTATDTGDRPQSSSMDQNGANAQHRASAFGDFDISSLGKDGQVTSNGDTSPTLTGGQNSSGPKPQVGTEEWHKVRRDNHKEVERRRRETINEGINELAKIVPGCEKNKGSILARAVQFITQLKENETQNIEKWSLEKLLTEQAITELSSSVDKLKAECQRAWTECEQWKTAAQKAGISVDGDVKPRGEAGEEN